LTQVLNSLAKRNALFFHSESNSLLIYQKHPKNGKNVVFWHRPVRAKVATIHGFMHVLGHLRVLINQTSSETLNQQVTFTV